MNNKIKYSYDDVLKISRIVAYENAVQGGAYMLLLVAIIAYIGLCFDMTFPLLLKIVLGIIITITAYLVSDMTKTFI